ncbi:MAG TPA: serine hydrolase domain-containing protein [Gaiella sp.]|nr:serine hydrolase domain-containing protein [Gaiella sp.]
MRRFATWMLVLLTVTGTAASAAAEHETTAADAVRPALSAVVRAGSPGALVLVEDGASRMRVARGLAELRGRVPLRAGDRFRAGSITKTFVAVVVLQLVREGRLRLDDGLGRLLPGLVPNAGRVTIRQLLAHTSGLSDYAADELFLRQTASEPRRRWTPRELVGRALGMGPAGSPGERFSYASTNYVLLGLVVERLTGTKVGEQLRRRIFVPLRLHDTSFVPGARIVGHHAHGYAPSAHDGIVGSLATARDRSGASASWAWAAGAVVSTAPDLSRFFAALLGGRLLPLRLLGAMRPAPGARYGLGLAAFRTPCGTALGHTGNVLGTVSAAWSTSDGRRRVVAMTNSYPLSPTADTAFRRLLETAFCG